MASAGRIPHGSDKFVRDKKTGKVRKKDMDRMKSGRKAAKKRSRKPHSAATRAKMSKSHRKVLKSGKTLAGRKALKRGRPKGIPQSAATRAKISKAMRKHWKQFDSPKKKGRPKLSNSKKVSNLVGRNLSKAKARKGYL